METLHVLKTKAEVAELLDYLDGVKELVAFDTETTGLGNDAEIIGWSVCVDPDEAYYVVNSYWDVETQKLIPLDTKELNKEAFEILAEKELIMHNAIFDCNKVQVEYGVSLIEALHTDTLAMSHLLDENRSNKLKDLGVSVLGLQDAKQEQEEMHASVTANGGQLTKEAYELYKGDCDLIGKYGAKDTILTMRLFLHFLPQLIDDDLFDFFYEYETMPLLKGPTYQMNTTGLKVDIDKLKNLGKELEVEIAEHAAFIDKELQPWVKDKYPGTKDTNTFNVGSGQQLAWLLFVRLNNIFIKVTKEGGRAMCKRLPSGKIPYSNKAKLTFIEECKAYRIPCKCCDGKGERLDKPKPSKKTGITPEAKLMVCKPCEGKGYKTPVPHKFFATDAETIAPLANKYKWVEALLKMKKAEKILGTYVNAILDKQRYSVIRPSFNQSGTDSGRYSSYNPNFQNIPREDKRVKECVIARTGKVFVGADFDQLEPRVFASVSGDFELQACFSSSDDFYSVIGARVFNKTGISLKKGAEGSFSVLYPKERQASKEVGLASTYGVGAFQLAPKIGRDEKYTQMVIDDFFEAFPDVKQMQHRQHAFIRKNGFVVSMFGRKRRIPEAKLIDWKYGKSTTHPDLPYDARNLLNISVNFPIQSAGASIMNRAAIRFYTLCKENNIDAQIVCQVHDELIIECWIADQELVSELLRISMEETTELPGVVLKAKPKAAPNFKELK